MRLVHRPTRPCASNALGSLTLGALLLAGFGLAACFESKRVIFSEDVSQPSGSPPGIAVGAAAPIEPLVAPREVSAQPASTEASAASFAPPPTPPPLEAAGAARQAVPVAADAGVAPPILSAECALAGDAPLGAVLFSGALAGGVCPTSLDPPYGTNWFTYQDSAASLAVNAVAPGCVAEACSLRIDGPPAGAAGYGSYGAGVALPVTVDGDPFDARGFAGVQFWARGAIAGTRGPGGAEAPQTLFAKFVTATLRQGDDFGAYCSIDLNDWSLCRLDFDGFARDGFSATPDPSTDVFDLERLMRLELEFRLFRPVSGVVAVPVSVAVELASISFY